MSVLETLEICFSANLNGVDEKLNGLVGQLNGLSGAVNGAGLAFAEGFRSGFLAGMPAVRAMMSGSGAEAAGLFAAGALGGVASARSSGRALTDGFAAGIRSGQSGVSAAVNAIVGAATRRIRSLLSIHSPSKVTAGLGGYFGEGFALGIGGCVSDVERAAAGLSGAALGGLGGAVPVPSASEGGMNQAVDAAVSRALGGLNLVVPLHVDGIKLGEASIRGINAVTRSAGRVMLEI